MQRQTLGWDAAPEAGMPDLQAGKDRRSVQAGRRAGRTTADIQVDAGTAATAGPAQQGSPSAGGWVPSTNADFAASGISAGAQRSSYAGSAAVSTQRVSATGDAGAGSGEGEAGASRRLLGISRRKAAQLAQEASSSRDIQSAAERNRLKHDEVEEVEVGEIPDLDSAADPLGGAAPPPVARPAVAGMAALEAEAPPFRLAGADPDLDLSLLIARLPPAALVAEDLRQEWPEEQLLADLAAELRAEAEARAPPPPPPQASV